MYDYYNPANTKSGTLYKRTPLPVTVKWTSKTNFESFLSDFSAHVGQQSNMGYIMKESFHSIYLKYGDDAYLTLDLANYRRIHSSLHFITYEQFLNDIGYLYNALKQALKSKGSDLIVQEEHTCDGIVVFHNLIQKYRYGGDMETYKTNLLRTLYTRYYTGYPGGALEYLDNWEDAAIRFDNIAPKEKTSSNAKRTNFGAQFTVINDIDFLIEQVSNTTNTWDKMADFLRKN